MTSAVVTKKTAMGQDVVVEEEDDDDQEAASPNKFSLVNPTSISPTSGSVYGTSRPIQPQLSTELSMELPTYDLLHNQDAYDGPGVYVTCMFNTHPTNTPNIVIHSYHHILLTHPTNTSY